MLLTALGEAPWMVSQSCKSSQGCSLVFWGGMGVGRRKMLKTRKMGNTAATFW